MGAIHSQGSAKTPSWPSLYDPGVEIIDIPNHQGAQIEGIYLTRAIDAFRFTLYWSLIFYTPIFFVCGVYAFLNLSFPPRQQLSSAYPLSPMSPVHRTPPRTNERRSRVTFALLVFLTFMLLSVGGAVAGSAVLGFVLAGFFKAAKYNMSTWVPFLWAVIQVLVGLLSIWPSVIDII